MKDLFGGDTPYPKTKEYKSAYRSAYRNKDGSWKVNPLHGMYGRKDGFRCKNCQHLIVKQYGKKYFKCALRENAHMSSPESDHRANWTACGKFKQK